jgi:hypothetical protein
MNDLTQEIAYFADSRGLVRHDRLITSTNQVYRKPPIKLCIMIIMSSCIVLLVLVKWCSMDGLHDENGFCIAGTQS